MRERIRSETGVLVPGVRLRISEVLGPRVFAVSLNGVPYAGGHAPKDAVLCLDATACREHGLAGERLENAWWGADAAMWLAREDVAEADRAGLPLVGLYEAMLWSLEGLVRLHLERFVGLAEVDYLVEEWRTENPGARSELASKALPNQAARIGFAGMLKSLVSERRSIADLQALLEVYAESGHGPNGFESAVAAAHDVAEPVGVLIAEGSIA